MMTDTLQRLTFLVKSFCEEREWDQFHNPKDLAIGISTEAAELLEFFRFQTESQVQELLSNPESRQKIENEIADIFFFLLRIADMNHINLENALTHKMKLNSLKYPVELARNSNKKYTDF